MLTKEEIEALDIDDTIKVGALAYLEGDRSTAVVIAYNILKDYVRNQSQSSATDSTDANGTLVGGRTNETPGGESGQSGRSSNGLDTGEDAGTISGSSTSGENSSDGMASDDGSSGNRHVGGATSCTRKERSGNSRSKSGSEVRSDGRNVRKSKGHEDSGRISSKDDGQRTEAGSTEDSADDIINSALLEIEFILTHP